jgi:hypothetical protein
VREAKVKLKKPAEPTKEEEECVYSVRIVITLTWMCKLQYTK